MFCQISPSSSSFAVALARQAFSIGFREPATRPPSSAWRTTLRATLREVDDCTRHPDRHACSNPLWTCPRCDLGKAGLDGRRRASRKRGLRGLGPVHERRPIESDGVERGSASAREIDRRTANIPRTPCYLSLGVCSRFEANSLARRPPRRYVRQLAHAAGLRRPRGAIRRAQSGGLESPELAQPGGCRRTEKEARSLSSSTA